MRCCSVDVCVSGMLLYSMSVGCVGLSSGSVWWIVWLVLSCLVCIVNWMLGVVIVVWICLVLWLMMMMSWDGCSVCVVLMMWERSGLLVRG